ncbi:MAG: MlaD family protein [Sulfurimonas sp.]|jgi:phospholipid/cholesterol/gamma-HCH transport system substrate-binding protein|nr:MlaD family protein [Sulfurimonas sp.]
MNNKVNYTLVGFIVLLGFTLMMGFSYWLLKPTSKDDSTIYIIYFDESVLGLNIDAPVKYRGLSVGKVTKLNLDPNNREQVEVQVTVQKDTPIKTNTLAKLTPQGITGLSYINLIMSESDASPLVATNGQKYPVIPSAPSFMDTIERSLGDVSVNLSEALSRTAELLDDKNKEQFALILSKSASVLDKIDRTLSEEMITNFQATMQSLRVTSQELEHLAPKMDALVQRSVLFEDEIAASIGSIKQTYLNVGLTMDRFRDALESGQFNIKEIASDVVPNMNHTLIELQQILSKTEDVLEKYERSPADLFLRQEEIKKGPGEE